MKGKVRLVFLGGLLLVVVVLLFGACVPRAPTPTEPTAPTPTEPTAPTEPAKPEGKWDYVVVDEWNFPILAALTGGFAVAGQEGKWLAEWWEKRINDAGGIAGRPVRVTFYDSGSEGPKAHTEMGKILDTKPLMVAMGTSSMGAIATMKMLAEEQVMSIMPCVGLEVNLEARPWGVSFVNYDENMAVGVRVWLERHPDIKKVVLIYDSTVETYKLIADASAEVLQSEGVEIVGRVDYEQMTTIDYGAVAIEVLGYDADGYHFNSIGLPVAKTIKEMYKRGMRENWRYFVGIGADYPDFYEVGEGYLEGAYVVSPFNFAYEGEVWQEVKKDLKEQRGSPVSCVTGCFCDIVPYFKYCIEHTGVTGDPTKLAEERLILAKFAYNIPDYPWTVSAPVDVVDGIRLSPIYLSQVDETNHKRLIEVITAENIPEAYLPAPQVPYP